MNRKYRRANGLATLKTEKRLVAHARHNADHWAEVRRIKQEFDALSDVEKAIRKPDMAASIDEHLAAIIAAN
jgi:hypothetical protein